MKSDVSFLKKNNQIKLLDAVLFGEGVLVLIAMISSQNEELNLALGKLIYMKL